MTIYNQATPLCENGCGHNAIRVTQKGKAVCSNKPAGCPAILRKMQNTSIERYGVPNVSSTQSAKDKRKQKSLDKYGVDNVSKADSIKEFLSERRSEYWHQVYSEKNFTLNGLTRLQYSHRCHQYANTQYQRYRDMLDPEYKRGKHWHLDHIYSVTDGFLNDVPINVISDVSNLRVISDKDNYKKHKKSEKTLAELYEGFSKLTNQV
jgi:Ni/Co efflux regulator RcnB